MESEALITIGISGSSAAGKTTLAALLARLIPHQLLLTIHADDFGKDFSELPRMPDGMLDADSKESVHFDRLRAAFDYSLNHKQLPADYVVHDFVERDLTKAAASFSDDLIANLSQSLKPLIQKLSERQRKVLLLDGFLLYHDEHLRRSLMVKIFLRTSYGAARSRRLSRYGGTEAACAAGRKGEFWKTESYFDRCVWSNYVKEHAFLFPDGDVEAEIDPEAIMQDYGVAMSKRLDVERDDSCRWAVVVIAQQLQMLLE